ncbi:hypothetical protein pipiens_008054 [Culex pipiens pipiens]|uniref:MARVEL domain-containing protein n=1 Tax=Culex pipiens pipiens TaxID=38569 RepID=A0ABD1DMJ6_CULPP|nr:uncharacterized protein LOC119770818 isoform X1 [Culex quinquefasciatus]XP_039436201.1 uncharacterized protein LOC120418024 isoform X1 [Culex pipiens pallens]XP_052566134.1 uncharacterized protein LOC120418024 isoform X1 [Culex pipiens pallens]
MVSQGMFRLMGYIYSIIAAIGSTIQAGSCLVKSAVDERDSSSSIGFLVAISWVIFSIILFVGIKTDNVSYLEAHRIFLFVATTVNLMYVILACTSVKGSVVQWNVEMTLTFLLMVTVVLSIFGFVLWVLNGLIRYATNDLDQDI